MSDKIGTREYRAHPFIIFGYLKPFLFVLLIPLLKALVQYIIYGQASGILLNELITAAIIIIYAVFKQRNFRLVVGNDGFIIKSGLILYRAAKVDFDKLSTIEVKRNPFDYLFRSATVRINTEAGKRGKADFEFKVSKNVTDDILYAAGKSENTVNVRFSPLKIAVMAAATSSSVTGMFIAVPIINQSGKLLGLALQDVLLRRINDVSEHFARYVPPVVNTVTIVFLAFYAASFLYSLLANINFKIGVGEDRVDVSSGLFARHWISFKKSAVNSAIIEQTPLMRMLDRCIVQVEIGGYGSDKGDRAVVIPSVDRQAAKAELAGVLKNVKKAKGKKHSAHKKSLFIYMLIPFYWVLGIVAACVVLVLLFPAFKDLTVFFTIISMGIMAYYFYLAKYNYFYGEISFAEVVYARHSKWANIREIYCEAQKLGIITLTRFPGDKPRGTCNVKIIIRSEAADSLTVKHVDYDSVLSQICGVYGIEKAVFDR